MQEDFWQCFAKMIKTKPTHTQEFLTVLDTQYKSDSKVYLKKEAYDQACSFK